MFRLDGVNHSLLAIRSHLQGNAYDKAESANNSYKEVDNKLTGTDSDFESFSQEVLGRISAIQIACIAMDAAITQAVRGTILLIAGLVTLNSDLIFEGIRDYISIVIQTVALTILAVLSLISPHFAEEFGRESILEYDMGTKQFFKGDTWGKLIANGLFSIANIPLSAARSALQVPVSVLDVDLCRTLGSIYCIVREPIASIACIFIDDTPPINKSFSFSFTQLHEPFAKDVIALLKTDCCPE